ncbi:MAG TPA: transcriptional regulator, partial [Treponemataceae bacterium]|nr:transcriptional regulator [Treponemataceae bacterium]
VYLPVMAVILKRKLVRKFRNRTPSDLYVWIVKQWDELKQKYGSDFSLDQATDTLEIAGERRQNRFFQALRSVFKRFIQT